MASRALGGLTGGGILLLVATILAIAEGRAQSVVGHPVSIHPGTCAVILPEPIAELGDVRSPRQLRAEPGATLLGDETAIVAMLRRTIDGELDDLLAAPHTVVVHNRSDYQQSLACGQIRAPAEADTEAVIVPLRQIADSGVAGIARLERSPRFLRGEQIAAEVYLFAELTAATPAAATPSADA